MSLKLLREYLRLSLSESPLARVPTQLMDPDEKGKGGHDCGCDSCQAGEACECGETEMQPELDEFSAVGGGGIAGYTGGLGVNPDKLGRKKNAPSKKK